LERLQVIAQVLYRINRSVNADNYVLKDGTGLLLCHGLNRFSEDIDLDGIRKVSLEREIQAACNDLDKYCFINKTKDTDTVLRYMVDYKSIRDQAYPLKVEMSFRAKEVLSKGLSNIEVIHGYRVYDLRDLINMKTFAFINRDKVRDFYDLYWCVKRDPALIGPDRAMQLLQNLYLKGVEQVTELLSEEASRDHILGTIDPEAVMIDFIDSMEQAIKQSKQ
jgi:predicted nucleotidyltransferase component of viral defense system